MILAVIFRITDIWKMGAPGCASVEYSAYSAGASGQFTQRNWLGTVYRCSHPYSQRTGPTHCISSLGTSGPDEKIHAEQSKTSDPGSSASQSAVCLQRIFRLQTFQQNK